VTAPLGPPVGYNLAASRAIRTATFDMPPGALLLFYTDGLVERRGEDLDERMERLRAAVRAAAPEAVCARVMATMVGTRPASDDIALVAVRRTR